MVDITIKVPGIEKLLDYVASGIGAVAGPMLAEWRAERMAGASRIEAQGKADSLQIISDAQMEARQLLADTHNSPRSVVELESSGIRQWVEFQEKKRLNNIESVIHRAADNIGDQQVPNDEPDPDWTARFFESVQDVSSEEMQELWARLLAGEIASPRSVSIRTISILRNMSRDEAEDFSAICSYLIDDLVHDRSYNKLSDRLPGQKIILLGELGLIHGALEVYKQIKLSDKGERILVYCGNHLEIKGLKGKELDLHGYVLTGPGKILARLCQTEVDMQYLRYFASFLASHDCTLSIAPIQEQQGTKSFSRPQDMQIVAPM